MPHSRFEGIRKRLHGKIMPWKKVLTDPCGSEAKPF